MFRARWEVGCWHTDALLASLVLFMTGCSWLPTADRASLPDPITYRAVEEGEIWFKNSAIQLRFDQEMYCRVFSIQNGKALSMNDIPVDPAIAKPTHFVEVDGKEIKDFRVDYRNVGASDIRTPLGTGKRLNLLGYAKTEAGLTLEKRLTIDLYQESPDLAIFSVAYRNLDNARPMTITKTINSFFRLDAARVHSGAPRFAFSCFQGLAGGSGGESVRLAADSSQSFNTRSASPASGEILPFIDLWTHEMGMAFGDFFPNPQVLTLPVQVASDQRVEVSIQSEEPKQLAPDGTLALSKSFLMVHAGDFKSPWQRFREIRKRLQ